MADAPPLTRVFITSNVLAVGQIVEGWARIEGDCCRILSGLSELSVSCEGKNWHRTRWAAENYARQVQAERLEILRAEVSRLESLRFGRKGP